MSYKIGQEVVIRKTLGRSGYYHGGTPQKVPLGTRGVIDYIEDGKIHLNLKTSRLSVYDWFVHPDELQTRKEQIRIEKEQQQRYNSLLEEKLAEDDVVMAEAVDETKHDEKTPENYSASLGLFKRVLNYFGFCKPGKIETLLAQKEPGEKLASHVFQPKFNVREEFAVWVNQEFPELKSYNDRDRQYGALINRKDEVYKAAKMACEHGIKTTNSCIRSSFENILRDLPRSNNYEFGSNIGRLTRLIEQVSVNLNRDGLHYGTHLANGGSISDARR